MTMMMAIIIKFLLERQHHSVVFVKQKIHIQRSVYAFATLRHGREESEFVVWSKILRSPV